MNVQDFKNSLDYLVSAELTPFIWGHSGIGKSSIVKQYARSKGLLFFPFYLGTQSDIGDILGLADFVRDENGTAIATKFAIPEWLRNIIFYCEENPDSGAIIFLDEFNRARKDILNGMFSLALDKTFHTIKLPKNCHIIAAGNPPTDEYFTTDINETALMARFVHIKLEPTFDEWIQYAKEKNMESTLIGFLREQPKLLEQEKSQFELPVKVDRRSYERLNKLFEVKTPTYLVELLMQGIIGIERTVAYKNYLKEVDRPLSGEEVINGIKFDLIKKWANTESIQCSSLNITCENLENTIMKRKENLNNEQKVNLMCFFELVPKDIVYPMIKNLVNCRNKIFLDFHTDPLYEKKLVTMMKIVKGL